MQAAVLQYRYETVSYRYSRRRNHGSNSPEHPRPALVDACQSSPSRCSSSRSTTRSSTLLFPQSSASSTRRSGQLQWIVDSYTLVFAGLLLTMGALGDRFSRRGALAAGLAIFGGASLASAFAESANMLIATRALMGIGGALIMPTTLSILTNVFPAEERPKAIGIWAAVAGIGVGIGPASRRLAARAVRLDRRLPRQRPDRRSRRWPPSRSWCRTRRTPSSRGSTRSAPCSRPWVSAS